MSETTEGRTCKKKKRSSTGTEDYGTSNGIYILGILRTGGGWMGVCLPDVL